MNRLLILQVPFSCVKSKVLVNFTFPPLISLLHLLANITDFTFRWFSLWFLLFLLGLYLALFGLSLGHCWNFLLTMFSARSFFLLALHVICQLSFFNGYVIVIIPGQMSSEIAFEAG